MPSPYASAATDEHGPPLNVAPGSVVVVRDDEWLVTAADETQDGLLVHVQGLSELVRDTTAAFYEHLDDIRVLDPAEARVEADDSPGYRRAKLWLEATLRKTAIPLERARPHGQHAACSPTRSPTSSRPCARRSTRRTCARASCSPTRSASARRSRSA